ncbi:MAG: metal-dependent transcriptional regulator [Actinobacteria bacterium]|nr:metal-dependent transcriptional regulator [Actinomycetota bacterium]
MDNDNREESEAEGRVPGAVDGEALSESQEDYLEAILLLERESRVARVSEIADQLNVSRPSVTGALKNLAARGLVAHEPYGHVTLTDEGADIALEVERRHVAVRDFLVDVLGVPDEKADITACRLEHVLEPDVLAHFVAYAEEHKAALRSRDPQSVSGSEVAR